MNIENPSLISWSTPQHGDFNWGYSWISMECKWVYHGIMSITTGWSSDTYIYIYAYIFMGFWWRYSWTYNGNLQLTICDRDSMWGWIATTSLWPLMCLMNYHFPSFISGSSPANHILCRPEGRNFHELQNLVQTCASHILPATYECQEKTQSFYQGHHFATGGKKTWINSFWPKNYSIYATCSPSGAEKGAQSHCKGRGTEEEGYRGCGGVRWGWSEHWDRFWWDEVSYIATIWLWQSAKSDSGKSPCVFF